MKRAVPRSMIVMTIATLLIGAASEISAAVALPTNGRIAYLRFRPRADVVTIRPDGSGTMRVTNSPFWSPEDAAWSPDGTRLAIAQSHYGTPQIERLIIVAADGTQTAVVSRPRAKTYYFSIAWMPDGSSLLMCRNIVGRSGGRVSVYTVKTDGTAQTRIGLRGDCDPSPSPDGSMIAFSARGRLATMNSDGSNRQIVAAKRYAFGPDWSPDGSTIVFARAFRISKLFTIHPDGTGLTRLTTLHKRDESAPAWSPDGSRIAFQRRTFFSQWDLWTMSSDGSSERRLTHTRRRNEISPDWQPVP